MSEQHTATSNVAACASLNLLADEFTEVFLAGTNTQIVTLAAISPPRRRPATTYQAWVFNFDTCESAIIILSAETPLDVGQ